MKLHIAASSLVTAATRLQNIVSDKNLSYIGIRTVNDRVELSATDKIISIYTVHDANIEEQGSCFVNAKVFLSIVKEAPQVILTLSTYEKYLELSSVAASSFQFKIPSIIPEVWETTEEIEEECFSKISSSNLKYLIDQVEFVVDQDCHKSYGKIAYFQKIEDEKFRLVGTDGYRLSYAEVKYESCSPSFLTSGVTLSKRNILELVKMSQQGFETINLTFTKGGTCLVAQVQDYSIYSKLSVVAFPDFKKVISESFNHKVSFNKKFLQEIVNRILLVSGKTNIIRLIFSNNLLTVKGSAGSIDSFEGKEEIPIEYPSEELKIVINGLFLKDCLNAIQTTDVLVEFNAATTPIRISPVGEKENLSGHIIVPINERA